MFELNNPYLIQEACERHEGRRENHEIHAVRLAAEWYQRMQTQGWFHRVWSTLTRAPRYPLDLRTIEGCKIRGRSPLGLQTVLVANIRGSEGRTTDFDAQLRPRQPASRSRWTSIAAAHFQGLALPPVELIQVNELYFVRDGHHRVSVARTLGQSYIEAHVTLWQVVGPLPWEQPALAPHALPMVPN